MKGYLYVATGEYYINEAIVSSKSLKEHDSEAHITLITNSPIEHKIFNDVKVLNFKVNDWKDGTLFKLHGLLESKYNKTFFVDTDTFFCDRCDELFKLLEFFDACIMPSPGEHSGVIVDNKELDGYFSYNSGVIVYNNNQKFKNFIADAIKSYEQKYNLYPGDQQAIMDSLLNHNLKIYPLQNLYNFRTGFYQVISKDYVKILHGHEDNFKNIQNELNKVKKKRIWVPGKGLIYHQSFKEKLFHNRLSKIFRKLRFKY